jgi:hypothetical protein
MATCPFSGRRTDDAPSLPSGGGCPYSGATAQPPARGLSRRGLLKFGLAALAAGRTGDAEAHLIHAVEFDERIGARRSLQRSRAELERLHSRGTSRLAT